MGRAFVPVALSSIVPSSEAVAGAIGTGNTAARDNHTHKRLTSATVGVLDLNGEASITFTRLFNPAPTMAFTAVETPDGGAVIFKVKSWATSGSDTTGCVVKGYRIQPLPSVITLLTQLLNFRVDAGNASGLNFTAIALERSA